MNDIEIIISALEDLKEKINFDHNKERFENNTYKSAINYALATIKERQEDKDRIKELEEENGRLREKVKKIEEYVKQCDWHNNDVYIGEDILDLLEESD